VTFENRDEASAEQSKENTNRTGAEASKDASRHQASSSFVGSKHSITGLPHGSSLLDVSTPQEAYHGIQSGETVHALQETRTPGLPREVSVSHIEMQKGENEVSPGLTCHQVTLDLDSRQVDHSHGQRIRLDQQNQMAAAPSDEMATDRERFEARMENIFRD
jgi:hypothetical protein